MKLINKYCPYSEIIDIIREMTKDENGYEVMKPRIVRIYTSILGEDNQYLGVSDGEYYWENDWYEGGNVVLIGFIDLDEVKVNEIE